MNEQASYNGRCFCGAVRLKARGEPAAAGYCHCDSCRSWSAGPINGFTLWKPESVQIVEGEDKLGAYNKTEASTRKWCTECGGHVLTDHPAMGLVDIYAAVIPDYPFHPDVHVNYQETVLPIRDGLPKLKDVPMEMGGSGEVMAE